MQSVLIAPVTESGRPEYPSESWILHLSEARLALAAGVNLLLIGPDDHIRRMIRALRPEMAPATATWQPGSPLVLPGPTAQGTLILHHVNGLDAAEQQRLLDWMEGSGRHVRIISTAPGSVYPLMKAGRFLEMLHYRLNVVTVDLRD